MPSDREEPNRVLGFAVRTRPHAVRSERQQAPGAGRPAPRGGEAQRVLGFRADWLDQAGRVLTPALARPLRAWQRWANRHQRR